MTAATEKRHWVAGTFRTEDLRACVEELAKFLEARAEAHRAGGRVPFADKHDRYAQALDEYLRLSDNAIAVHQGTIRALETALAAPRREMEA